MHLNEILGAQALPPKNRNMYSTILAGCWVKGSVGVYLVIINSTLITDFHTQPVAFCQFT